MSVNIYCIYGQKDEYLSEIHISRFLDNLSNGGRIPVEQSKEFSKPLNHFFLRPESKTNYCLYHFEVPKSTKLNETSLGIISDKNVYYQSKNPLARTETTENLNYFIFGLEFEIKIWNNHWRNPPGFAINNPIEEIKIYFHMFYLNTDLLLAFLQQLFKENANNLKPDEKKTLFEWICFKQEYDDIKIMRALLLKCFDFAELMKFSKNSFTHIEWLASNYYELSIRCSENKPKEGFIDKFKSFFFGTIKMRGEFIPFLKEINQRLLSLCLIFKQETFKKICKPEKTQNFYKLFFESLLPEVKEAFNLSDSTIIFEESIKRGKFEFLFKNSDDLVDLIRKISEKNVLTEQNLDSFHQALKLTCQKLTKDGNMVKKLKKSLPEIIKLNPNLKEMLNMMLEVVFQDFTESNHRFRNLLEFYNEFIRDDDLSQLGIRVNHLQDPNFIPNIKLTLAKTFLSEKPYSLGNFNFIQELEEKYPGHYKEVLEEVNNNKEMEGEIKKLINDRKVEFKDKITTIFKTKLYQRDPSIWKAIFNTNGLDYEVLWNSALSYKMEREAKNNLLDYILKEAINLNSWSRSREDFHKLCNMFQTKYEINVDKYILEFLKKCNSNDSVSEFLKFCIKTAELWPDFSYLICQYVKENYKSDESDNYIIDILKSYSNLQQKGQNSLDILNIVLEKNSKFAVKEEDIFQTERTRNIEIASLLAKIYSEARAKNLKFENRLIKATLETCAGLKSRIEKKNLKYEELNKMSNIRYYEIEYRLEIINMGFKENRLLRINIDELLTWFKTNSEKIKTLELLSNSFLSQFPFQNLSTTKIIHITQQFRSEYISNFNFPDFLVELLEEAKFIEATHQSVFFQKIVQEMKITHLPAKENLQEPISLQLKRKVQSERNPEVSSSDSDEDESGGSYSSEKFPGDSNNNDREIDEDPNNNEQMIEFLQLAQDYKTRFNDLYCKLIKGFDQKTTFKSVREYIKCFSSSNLKRELNIYFDTTNKDIYRYGKADLEAKLKIFVEDEELVQFAKGLMGIMEQFKLGLNSIEEGKIKFIKNLIGKLEEDHDEDEADLDLKSRFELLKELEKETQKQSWKENVKDIIRLYNSKELFDFLNEKNYNDIKFLIEEFDEVDENYFLISRLEAIFRLYEKLGEAFKNGKIGTLRKYYDVLQDSIKEKQNSEALKNIETVMEKMELIKDLFLEATNNQEANNLKIKKMINSFTLSIEFNEFELQPVSCKFKIGNSSIDFQDIKENRDKLQLTSKEIKKKYEKFIPMIDDLELFVNNVQELYSAGAPIEAFKDITVVNMDFTVWNSSQKAEEKRIWKEIIEIEHAENYMSTLFWGRQICILCELFEEVNYSTRVISLLEFIFGNKIRPALPKVSESLTHLNKKLTIFEKLKVLSSLIFEEIGEDSDPHPEMIKNMLRPEYRNLKGEIRLIIVKPSEVETRLLTLFLELTSHKPAPQNVLFCNKWTKKEQIFAFLYRCFTCKFSGVLFSIINYENLLPSVKNHFEEGLLTLFERYERNLTSVLAIFTSVRESQFNSKIISLERKNSININQNFSNELLKAVRLNNQVMVVTSEYSGLGKSYFIRKTALEEDLKYNYFPISGEISIDSIVRRLIKLGLDNEEPSLLHIDIEEVTKDSIPILNEIIFKIIILGGLYYLEEIFQLPERVNIFIELSMSVLGNRQFRLNLNLHSINLTQRLARYPLEIGTEEINPKLSDDIKLVANFLLHDRDNTLDSTTISLETLRDIPEDTARVLIENSFGQEIDTYYQKLAFINSLADQLGKFSNNFCFSYEYLSEIGLQNQNIRKSIFQLILKNTAVFVKLHYQNLIDKQRRNLDSFKAEANDEENNLPDISKEIVSFKEMGEHFILTIFDKSGSSIYPIQCNNNLIPINLINVYKVQERTRNEERDIRNKFDYQRFDSKHLVEELCSIFCVASKNINIENYVFTPDNFLKMNLIYLKTCSRVPVIMCGETGCGKTSLLKIMVKELLGEDLHTVNFHSGITEKILVGKLGEIFKKYQNFTGNHINENKKKIWIFLDEINTCDCLGVVSELMVKRTLLGAPVSDDFLFVAACNPFRLKSKKELQFGLRSKHDHGALKLAYIVKPLPINLMNFVFDFGALKKEDERRYIECMLQEIKLDGAHREDCIKCLTSSQDFIREKEEDSSVSLRDINRFTKIYNWFKKNLERLNDLRKDQNNLRKDWRTNEGTIKFNSLVLALYTCYYFKLKLRENRDEYLKALVNCLDNRNRQIDIKSLKQIYDDEVEFYLSNMEIPEGIAKNESLKENVFIMIVCICNTVPVIVSGKPGCSKTLSVNLIQNNMNGKNSNKEFFKRLPRIYFKTYQGSLTSTSEEIEKVFESAYKKNKEVIAKKEDEDVRIVVFFDELGLAEISRNNPLKVLHGLLEPDINDKQKQVGFIGISNWRLDASKINRVVYLAKPDPEESDLKKTASEIALSYGEEMNKYAKKFEEVALKYHQFKIKMSRSKIDFEEFFGTRDFYSCIKLICHKIKTEKGYEIDTIIKNSIYRNFGGTSDSVSNFLVKDYNSYDIEREPILELIKQNLKDNTARYLMMITKHKGGLEILSQFLSEDIPDPRILVGSSFEDDLRDEEYAFKILSEITDCTEKGKMVVLLNLNVLYPTLYDLFNQNFKIINKERRCRVALGYKNNSYCPVHKDFKCIVMIDEKEVSNHDPPFLNRFEKQMLNFKSELNQIDLEIANNIGKYLENALPPNPKSKILLPLNKLLLNYHIDEIYAILNTLKFKGEDLTDDQKTHICFEKICRMATGDFFLALEYRKEANSGDEIYDKLLNYYFKENHQSLAEFFHTQGYANTKFIEQRPNLKVEVQQPSKILKVEPKKNISSLPPSQEPTFDLIKKELPSFPRKQAELDEDSDMMMEPLQTGDYQHYKNLIKESREIKERREAKEMQSMKKQIDFRGKTIGESHYDDLGYRGGDYRFEEYAGGFRGQKPEFNDYQRESSYLEGNLMYENGGKNPQEEISIENQGRIEENMRFDEISAGINLGNPEEFAKENYPEAFAGENYPEDKSAQNDYDPNNPVMDFNLKSRTYLIYTFSNMYEQLGGHPLFEKSILEDQRLYAFSSEKEISLFFQDFFNSEVKVTLVLRFHLKYHHSHFLHIKYLVDNLLIKEELREKAMKKVIIFILHLDKAELFDKSNTSYNMLSQVSNWECLFIDRLSPKASDLTLNSIRNKSLVDIVNGLNLEDLIALGLRSSVINLKFEKNQRGFMNYMLEHLPRNKYFMKLIKDKILQNFEADTNWRETIVCEGKYGSKEHDVCTAIKNLIEIKCNQFILNFLYMLQKKGGLETFATYFDNQKEYLRPITQFFDEDERKEKLLTETELLTLHDDDGKDDDDDEIFLSKPNYQHNIQRNIQMMIEEMFKDYWREKFNSLKIDKDLILSDLPQGNELSRKVYGMRFPFIQDFFEQNEDLIKRNLENFYNIQSRLRKLKQDEEELDAEIKNFMLNEEKLIICKNIDLALRSSDIFRFIEKQNGDAIDEVKVIVLQDLIQYVLSTEYKVNSHEIFSFTFRILHHFAKSEKFTLSFVWLYLKCYKDTLDILLRCFEQLSLMSPTFLRTISSKEVFEEIRNVESQDLVPELVDRLFKWIFCNQKIFMECLEKENFKDMLVTLADDILNLETSIDFVCTQRHDIIFWKDLLKIMNLVIEDDKVKNDLLLNLFQGKQSEEESILKSPGTLDIIFREFSLLRKKLTSLGFKAKEKLEALFNYESSLYYRSYNRNPETRLIKYIIEDENILKYSKKIFRVLFEDSFMLKLDENDIIDSVTSTEFLTKDSELIEEIEYFFSKNGVNNNQAVFFIDLFQIEISTFWKEKKDKLETLLNNINKLLIKLYEIHCEIILNFFNRENLYFRRKNYIFQNIAFLFATGYSKFLLDYHAKMICFSDTLNEARIYNFKEMNRIIQNIEDKHTELYFSFQVYLLKAMGNVLGSHRKLSEFDFKALNLEFLSKLILKKNGIDTSLDYEIYDFSQREVVRDLTKIMIGLFENCGIKTVALSSLKKYLTENSDPAVIRSILNLIVNRITFKRNRNNLGDNAEMTKWHEEFLDILSNHYPKHILELTRGQLKRFPDARKALDISMEDVRSNDDKCFYSLLFHTMNYLSCFKQQDKNIYNISFSQRDAIRDLANLFIPGLDEGFTYEEKSMEYGYRRACDVLNNPDNFMVKNKAVYICSCNYVYFIDDCGGPQEIRNCPNNRCNQPIGGKDYFLMKRENHFRVFLNEEEKVNQKYYKGDGKLVADLEFKINELYLHSKPGFPLPYAEYKEDPSYKVRMTSPFSSNLLGFISYTFLFLAWSTKVIEFEDLRHLLKGDHQNFNIGENIDLSFIDILKNIYFKRLFWNIPENYKQTAFEFLHMNLEKFIDLCFGTMPKSAKERTIWEAAYEQRIAALIKQNNININNYRTVSHELRSEDQSKELNIFSWIDESIDLQKLNDNLRMITPYYRFIDRDPINSLEATLKLPEKRKLFPFLATMFDMKHEIKKISGCFKIIDFLNSTLEEFDHRISRDYARDSSIEDAFHKFSCLNLMKKFPDFVKAWEDYYKDYPEEEVSFDCHRMKIKKKLNKGFELALVLPDDKEEGRGMYSAAILQDIINSQNTVMSLLKLNLENAGNNAMLDKLNSEVPIAELSEYELLGSKNLEKYGDLETIADEFTYYELEYGKGGRKIFNLNLMNEDMFVMVFNRKKLVKKEIKFIKYHFEITKDNRIISELREKLKQEPVEELLKSELTSTIAQRVSEPVDCYRSIQSIIYIVNNGQFGPGEGNSLPRVVEYPILKIYEENCKKWKLGKDLEYLLSEFRIQLKNLEAIFEIIEFNAFKEILEKVPTDYKKDLIPKDMNALEAFFSELEKKNGTMNKLNLLDAIKKFVSRYLVASNLKPDSILRNFLIYDDIWSQKIADEEEFWNPETWILKNFPESIKVSQAVKILEIFGSKQAEQRKITSQACRNIRKR